uniref:Uncharacterized protein n=1 Tax=Anopheles culicifacies TaxID=139723 RepID=A0A182M0S5_9DIPT
MDGVDWYHDLLTTAQYQSGFCELVVLIGVTLQYRYRWMFTQRFWNGTQTLQEYFGRPVFLSFSSKSMKSFRTVCSRSRYSIVSFTTRMKKLETSSCSCFMPKALA